ncbi:MAG TPA: hypothetical protein VMR28_03525 [Candidatus Saccharimonadales bacterium]|nr:hypothetical protein [Candidatus Saccharimonadales bacterium]
MTQPDLFEGSPSTEHSDVPSVDTAIIAGQIATAADRHPYVPPERPPSEAAQDQGWDRRPAERAAPSPEARFKKRFDWLPHSKGEVTLALNGLRGAVDEASKYGLSRVEETVTRARGYQNSSMQDMLTLREAFATPEELDSLSAIEIRNNPQILRILAAHQLFAGALDKEKLPINKKGNLDKKPSPLMLELYGSEDTALTSLWGQVFNNTRQRGRFWLSQLNEVHDHPRVVESRHEQSQRSRS